MSPLAITSIVISIATLYSVSVGVVYGYVKRRPYSDRDSDFMAALFWPFWMPFHLGVLAFETLAKDKS